MCIHTYMHRHIIHSYTHAYTHECVWLTHTHMNTHIHTHRFKAEGGSRGRHSNPSPHELKQEEHKFEVGSTWASNQETTSETKQTPFASPKPDRFWQSCFLSSFILSLDVISHFWSTSAGRCEPALSWLRHPELPPLVQANWVIVVSRVCRGLTTYQCCALSGCWHFILSSPSLMELWKHWPSVLYIAHIQKRSLPSCSKLFPCRKAIGIAKSEFWILLIRLKPASHLRATYKRSRESPLTLAWCSFSTESWNKGGSWIFFWTRLFLVSWNFGLSLAGKRIDS